MAGSHDLRNILHLRRRPIMSSFLYKHIAPTEQVKFNVRAPDGAPCLKIENYG